MTDHSAAPEPDPEIGRNAKLGLLVGASALLLLAAVALTVNLTSGSGANSVQDVADQTVHAAQNLDVDAGFDLLCEAPGADQRASLVKALRKGIVAAGTNDPALEVVVTNLTGDTTGTFDVSLTSRDLGLRGRDGKLSVEVSERDGHSCISNVNGLGIDLTSSPVPHP